MIPETMTLSEISVLRDRFGVLVLVGNDAHPGDWQHQHEARGVSVISVMMRSSRFFEASRTEAGEGPPRRLSSAKSVDTENLLKISRKMCNPTHTR